MGQTLEKREKENFLMTTDRGNGSCPRFLPRQCSLCCALAGEGLYLGHPLSPLFLIIFALNLVWCSFAFSQEASSPPPLPSPPVTSLSVLTEALQKGIPVEDYIELLLAKELMAQGKNEEVLHHLKIAGKISRPVEKEILWQKFICFLDLNKFKEASLLLAKASKLAVFRNSHDQNRIKFYQQLYDSKTGKNRQSVKEPYSPEKVAQVLLKEKKYEEAARAYQELWDHPEPHHNRRQILYDLATSYGRSDQFDKALEAHQKLITLFPKSSAESRYKIPYLYFDSGQYAKAFEAFDVYLKSNWHYKKNEALWYRFWSAVLSKNFEQGFRLLDNLSKKEKNQETQQKILYWKGRLSEQLNQKKLSLSFYQQVLAKKPVSYYGMLAFQRLHRGLLDPFLIVNPQHLSMIPSAKPLPPSQNWTQRLSPDHPLVVGSVLAHAGLSAFAFEETETMKGPPAGFDLTDYAVALQDSHNFHHMQRMGAMGLKKTNFNKASSIYWTLAYPKAYPDSVFSLATEKGIDPLLVLALMREESAFKPTALSSADAIGLTQIIPKTADEIAQALGVADFQLENLLEVKTSIRFGIYYLSERLSQFGGSLPYAIASYNAGPEAVTRWKKWGDPLEADLFIDLIPYDETRDYVKKVLKSYWIYKKLYSIHP